MSDNEHDENNYTLEIVGDSDTKFSLVWVDTTGEAGCALGEEYSLSLEKLCGMLEIEEDASTRECLVANIAVLEMTPVPSRVSTTQREFVWETRKAVTAALRAVKTALKADKSARKNKPWPEWAKLASAAGWKAPKGWMP